MSRGDYQASNIPNVHSTVTFSPNTWQPSPHRPISRNSSKATSREPASTPSNIKSKHTTWNGAAKRPPKDEDSGFDSDFDDMEDRRPPLHKPADGRSHQPLLGQDDDEERGRTGYETSMDGAERPHFSRRSTMRSRSPDTQAKLATKKKYTYAAFFLGLSLVSFVVQTETAVYIQHELKWNKAYCML
jgi:hypothetical protein